jgi:CheY-like chemotaxis protein
LTDLRLAADARILIVEDDGDMRNLLCKTLEKRGFEPRTAEDGNEALEVLENDERLALVISDLDMPGLSGVEFLKRATYAHPSLSVIIASGIVDPEIESVLLELGIREILRKPFAVSDLVKLVVDTLSDHHYDEDIVACLAREVPPIVTGGGTGLDIVVQRPFLRVSSQMLGRLSAFVDVAGPDLRGKLVVSGAPFGFARVRRAWLSQQPTTRSSLWDVAGEIANQLAGVVRAHYVQRGLEANRSVPMIVEGERVRLGYMTQKPSLVVPFAVEGWSDPLYVEWSLAALGPAKLAA